MSEFIKYFCDFFASTQRFDGSWDSLTNPPSSLTRRIAYTSQILLGISECLSSDKEAVKMARNGIAFLESVTHPNPLFERLLKAQVFGSWPKMVDMERVRRQLKYHIEHTSGEYGGRINAHTFELCLAIDVLNSTKTLSILSQEKVKEYETKLESMLAMGPKLVSDISHYAWIIELSQRLGKPCNIDVISDYCKRLRTAPFSNGQWLLETNWTRPSDTPVLRCNDFLTAHVVLSCSRLLKNTYSEELYKIISQVVEHIVMGFDFKSVWRVKSQLSGEHDADPYMCCLILRALFAYSQLSDTSYKHSMGVLDKEIKFWDDKLEKKTKYFRKEIMQKKPKIFIIHGHNNELKREVQLLLSRAGVEDVVLHECPDKGRTIIDKLIEESDGSNYAISIMSPDDLTKDGKLRARQNVILEIGFFIGKLGKSHVRLLKKENVEIPSDLQGILYEEYDEKGSWKAKLLKEMAAVGLNIDIKGAVSKL